MRSTRRAGPAVLSGLAIATLEHVLGFRGRLPGCPDVEQVHEEVVGQRLRSVGEDTVLGLPGVGVQDAHAADKSSHLGSRQRQHERLVDQQVLRRELVALLEVVAEPVGGRLEHGEGFDVGLLLRGIGAPRA